MMLSVVMLSVIVLSANMLNILMLSVVPPTKGACSANIFTTVINSRTIVS
jgi:hypothetical protein